MTAATIPGYEIAFHASLAQPITLAGVPRTVAILNGTTAAVLSLGLQVPWIGVPAALVIHSIAFWLTSQDPYFFDLLFAHVKHRPYLDA
jgi:type IV secretion system protein VirB3